MSSTALRANPHPTVMASTLCGGAIFSTGDADLFLPWQNDATALRANPHPAFMASTLCVGAIFSSDNAILS
ncbi:MAG: hypothetical protein ACK46D_00390, partial [Roseiflexaceae bacterium]